MGRLTAGRGADRYRTTTTSAPSRTQYIPSGGYAYGNPYSNFQDSRNFTRDYLNSSAAMPNYNPDKRFYPPGYRKPGGLPRHSRTRPPLMRPAAGMSPATGPKGARGSLPRVEPGPLPGQGLRSALMQIAFTLLNELGPEWAKQNAQDPNQGSYDFAGAGWTPFCQSPPVGLPAKQLGLDPPPAGLPSIGPQLCTISGTATSNADFGWTDFSGVTVP